MKQIVLVALSIACLSVFAENTTHGNNVMYDSQTSFIRDSTMIGERSVSKSKSVYSTVAVGNNSCVGVDSLIDSVAVGNNTLGGVSNVVRTVAIGKGELNGVPLSDSTSINESQLFISKPMDAFCINPDKATALTNTPFYYSDGNLYLNTTNIVMRGKVKYTNGYTKYAHDWYENYDCIWTNNVYNYANVKMEGCNIYGDGMYLDYQAQNIKTFSGTITSRVGYFGPYYYNCKVRYDNVNIGLTDPEFTALNEGNGTDISITKHLTPSSVLEFNYETPWYPHTYTGTSNAVDVIFYRNKNWGYFSMTVRVLFGSGDLAELGGFSQTKNFNTPMRPTKHEVPMEFAQLVDDYYMTWNYDRLVSAGAVASYVNLKTPGISCPYDDGNLVCHWYDGYYNYHQYSFYSKERVDSLLQGRVKLKNGSSYTDSELVFTNGTLRLFVGGVDVGGIALTP